MCMWLWLSFAVCVHWNGGLPLKCYKNKMRSHHHRLRCHRRRAIHNRCVCQMPNTILLFSCFALNAIFVGCCLDATHTQQQHKTHAHFSINRRRPNKWTRKKRTFRFSILRFFVFHCSKSIKLNGSTQHSDTKNLLLDRMNNVFSGVAPLWVWWSGSDNM